MLKALDIVGLSWLIYLTFSVEVKVEIADRWGSGHCASVVGVSHCSALSRKIIQGWKGGSDQLSNHRFRRTNVDSILAI